MSAMFDYISGKDDSEVGRLKAELEHVMAHCVPGGAYDEVRDALRDCMKYVPAHVEEKYRKLLED